MSCAVRCASFGLDVTLVSPFISERSQSVMAAGGINAVVEGNDEGDTVASHIEDTLKGGGYLAKEEEVRALCERGGEIIEYLKSIGTVFSVNEDGRPAKRAFGGQSHKRTYYCGTSTGKQIVSALVNATERFFLTRPQGGLQRFTPMRWSWPPAARMPFSERPPVPPSVTDTLRDSCSGRGWC